MIAAETLRRLSTSGRGCVVMNDWMNVEYVSLMRRCDSAAIVPNTRLDLPEPETPVKTLRRRFGMSSEMPCRLFSCAPRTSMTSCASAMCREPLRSSVLRSVTVWSVAVIRLLPSSRAPARDSRF